MHEVRLDTGAVVRSRVGRVGSVDEAVVISVRPKNIVISKPSEKNAAQGNLLTGRVRAASFLGNMVRHEIVIAI